MQANCADHDAADDAIGSQLLGPNFASLNLKAREVEFVQPQAAESGCCQVDSLVSDALIIIIIIIIVIIVVVLVIVRPNESLVIIV